MTPDRIWAEPVDGDWNYDSGAWGVEKENDADREFVRADLYEALIQENERLGSAMVLAEAQYMALGGNAGPEWVVNSMRDILNEALNEGEQ